MSTTMRSGRSRINIPTSAPLPSPIPTGKGSRSAANDTLSEYLHKSTTDVPDLILPHQGPAEINLQSIVSGDKKSLKRLLKSARELGVFSITCNGIFSEELRSLAGDEAGGASRVSEEKNMGIGLDFNEGDGDKEQIAWLRSDETEMKWERECIGPEIPHPFSAKMQGVANKLDSIAQQLWGVFEEYMGQRPLGKGKLGKGSVLSLYRYGKNSKIELNPSFSKRMAGSKPCDHALSLRLPARRSQFFVQSAGGLLRFEAEPCTIVVTIGERIEEWSLGNFRCISEEVVCMPHPQGSEASFFVELKFLSLDIDISSSNNCNTISIKDQILIGMLITLFYKILVFLCSLAVGG